MSKRYYHLRFFFYILLMSALIISCSKSEDTTEKGGRPYFWKVEKEGKVSYLLGTIHIGISLDELLCSDEITEQLEKSDLVFTEWVEDTTSAGKDTEAELLLSDNGEDFAQLSQESQKFLTARGISSDLNYFGLKVVLELMCIKEAIGSLALYTQMDDQVEEKALAKNIPLKSLDKPDSLNTLLESGVVTSQDIENQIDMYHSCLSSVLLYFNEYKAGTLPVRKNENNEFNRVLLKDRNESWLTVFRSAHSEYERIFVAAGLAHFIGPFNFVDMLKSEGFSVERVSCQ